MSVLCRFGRHKERVVRQIKGVIKGTVDSMRGVFIVYACDRCHRKRAEFVSIAERKEVMPEFVEAYAKEDPPEEK